MHWEKIKQGKVTRVIIHRGKTKLSKGRKLEGDEEGWVER